MARYFVRTHPTDGSILPDIWELDDARIRRIDVSDGSGMYVHKAGVNLSGLEVLKNREPDWFVGEGALYQLALEPGQYYPRMARPFRSTKGPGMYPGLRGDADLIAVLRGQLLTLMAMLNRICQTVHPTQATFSTYGHDIRNLLILACTEVESHWRAVMIANGFKDPRNTRDYVRLQTAMRLGEYAVSFPSFPWMEPIRPFGAWGSSPETTKDLPWYDAYNGVKHNREREFHLGTLQRAFEAISACVIMLYAQFGDANLVVGGDIVTFFRLSSAPNWSPSEIYTYSYGHKRQTTFYPL